MKSNSQTLLTVHQLAVEYKTDSKNRIHAVSGVSFHIERKETLGLVGESGCGKSTIARAIVRSQEVNSGDILFEGKDLGRLKKQSLRRVRPYLQMIFQDGISSLNPSRKIGKTIAEPLRVMGVHDKKRRFQAARSMMEEVGLDPQKYFERRPFELSGGQCSRVAIARALITKPKLLICDEPVSSLDASIQAQILNLLRKLRSQHELTMLFISHDLSVIKNICDRVAVMYLGKLCEIAPSEQLFRAPVHPYTTDLLNAVRRIEKGRTTNSLAREAFEYPSPVNPPPGCRYHTKCKKKLPFCCESEPAMIEVTPGRWTACHYPGLDIL